MMDSGATVRWAGGREPAKRRGSSWPVVVMAGRATLIGWAPRVRVGAALRQGGRFFHHHSHDFFENLHVDRF